MTFFRSDNSVGNSASMLVDILKEKRFPRLQLSPKHVLQNIREFFEHILYNYNKYINDNDLIIYLKLFYTNNNKAK